MFIFPEAQTDAQKKILYKIRRNKRILEAAQRKLGLLRLKIYIKFCPLGCSERGTCAACVPLRKFPESKHPEKNFILYIRDDKSVAFIYYCVSWMFHELRHIWQKKKGLICSTTAHFYWKGKRTFAGFAGLVYSPPWELDADRFASKFPLTYKKQLAKMRH